MFEQDIMALANESAIANIMSGQGGPFAAIVVRSGAVVAKGVNQVTLLNDPTAHAEVAAIRAACQILDSFSLKGCELYTTCEPCPMCLGAIYWSRLERVYFGATKLDAAKAGFDDAFIYAEFGLPLSNRRIPMTQVIAPESLRIFEAWLSLNRKVIY